MKRSLVKKQIYAITIIFLLLAIAMIRFYPDNQGLGPFFTMSIIMIYLTAFGVLLGIPMLVFRAFGFIKAKSFIYIFSGTLNGSMGLYGTVLIIIYKHLKFNIACLLLLPLCIGVWILYDIYFRSRQSGLNNPQ